MPTVGERLAVLEQLARENRERIDALRDLIDGGDNVKWEQSVRGRLHAMKNAIDAADKLADAAREVRRLQTDKYRTRIKTWQWSVIAACAILTAFTPYVFLLTH